MQHIAVLDYGSQYTHLITRRIRELNVLAKIYPHDIKLNQLPRDTIGIILSGGPQSVYDKNALGIDKKIFSLKKPIMGICYGHQLMAHVLGGTVKPGAVREYGRAQLSIIKRSAKSSENLLQNLRNKTTVWMSHGDNVAELPEGFTKIGETNDCPITAMAYEKKKMYGLQFHPEVDHTAQGAVLLKNFVLKICQAQQNWQAADIATDLQKKIKKQVGKNKVFILVSGGVDSNVAFSLLTKTLGKDKVKGLYIDTGFMRQDESAEIQKGFIKAGFKNFETIDASDIFYKNLKNIFEPEAKRKIIGQTFLDVKDAQIQKLGLNSHEWLLGQGTIYPDIIESAGSKNAEKIKTHHNRVDAIKKMLTEGKMIEPLADFYKFEVRQIGKMLKLPNELIKRHPFPGPGLAIRCLCHVQQKIDSVADSQKKADELFKEKFPKINRAVLPFKSVGVQGDNRTYAHPLAVWGETDWNRLDKISVHTTNVIKDINRVILLLNTLDRKPNFKLTDDDVFLSRERIEVLRAVDNIVTSNLQTAGIYDDIWQFPVVLIPITNGKNKESIVLRPVNTRDVMTVNFYQMNKKILNKIITEILATNKISYVFYDITNKPPATLEWE